jgi:hypothetical protein
MKRREQGKVMIDRNEWNEFLAWEQTRATNLVSKDKATAIAYLWDTWLAATQSYREYTTRRIHDLLVRNTELVEENRRLQREPQEIATVQIAPAPHENQDSITQWAEGVFGPCPSNMLIAARALEELAELIMELARDDNSPKAIVEIADIFIVLYRLGSRLYGDIHNNIDMKMAVNRGRKWVKDGAGQGRHIKEFPFPTDTQTCSSTESTTQIDAFYSADLLF